MNFEELILPLKILLCIYALVNFKGWGKKTMLNVGIHLQRNFLLAVTLSAEMKKKNLYYFHHPHQLHHISDYMSFVHLKTSEKPEMLD